jgi:adenylyltransferase/sulfurtransferase
MITSENASSQEITVLELKARRDRGEDPFVLDVREPHEYEINRIPGSTLIPLGDLSERFTELDATREIVCQCKSGMRSARAAAFLREHGFKNVKNLKGGILAWVDQIDPSQPKY